MDGNKLSTIEMVVFEPLSKLFRGDPNWGSWLPARVFHVFVLSRCVLGEASVLSVFALIM